MQDKKMLVLGDNKTLMHVAMRWATESGFHRRVAFAQSLTSGSSPTIRDDFGLVPTSLPVLSLRSESTIAAIIADYQSVVSLHCHQIFPECLVTQVPCVNLHPGSLANGRGMYPYVFSLALREPTGATLHMMDRDVDHGPILAYRPVDVYSWDTCDTLYARVQSAECSLLLEWLPRLLMQDYNGGFCEHGGAVRATLPRTKQDYEQFRKLDLSQPTTLGGAICRLASLTFGEQSNAYFVDDDGAIVRVRIVMDREKPSAEATGPK